MIFAVFDVDGEAVRMGSCPESKMDRQAREGETVIAWDRQRGSPADWVLVDGELVER